MSGPQKARLRLLGGFDLAPGADSLAPVRMTSRKGCGLIAYLALQPDGTASRAQLATLLWSDRYDTQARQNLRQCLASLRGDMNAFAPGLLLPDRDTVCLRIEKMSVDAIEFARFAAATCIDDLRLAADLYRGAFLSGLDLETETFDEWRKVERARLENLAADVFGRLADSANALGNGDEAITAVERLVALDPLREDWQRQALLIHARYRGRDVAVARARAFSELLQQELDTAPEPATRMLIDDIRNGAVAPVTRTANVGATTPAAGQVPNPANVETIDLHATTGGPRATGSHRMRWLIGGTVAASLAVAAIATNGMLPLARHDQAPAPMSASPGTSAAAAQPEAQTLAQTAMPVATDVHLATSSGPRDPIVHKLVARGRDARFRGPDLENINAGLVAYEEALRRDPNFVPALVGLAGRLVSGASTALLERGPALARAEALLTRAEKLAPRTESVHIVFGILHKVRRDYDAALASFRRALELNPIYSKAHGYIGHTMALMGQAEQGLKHITYAMQIAPEPSAMHFWTLFAGRAEIELGHYQAAIDWLKRSIAIVPNNPAVHAHLASAYALLGDTANAARHADAFETLTAKPLEAIRAIAARASRTHPASHYHSRFIAGLRVAAAAQSPR